MAATKEIKVGDVVRLRTGGDKMTVEHLNTTTASVVWFDKHGNLLKDKIGRSALMFVSA